MRHKQIISILFLGLFLNASHAVTLKIATLSPDGTSWMKKMRAGAKTITEQTNNRVKFKFYPGAVMGNDQAVLKKIRIGQLHGGAVTGGTLIPFYPDSEVYNIALTFESSDEVDYVRNHMDKELIKGLEKGGFVIFGIAASGFNYIMSKEPILSVADLAKQKAWVPAGDENAMVMVQNFSITPIPLPVGDVLAGLQTGLINTVAISPIGALALQWHTQIKYITDMPLLFGYGTLAISTKAFKKIKKSDQEIVRKVFTQTFREIDAQNKKDNIAAMQALRNQGITFVKPSAEQLAEWKTMTNVATQRLVDSGKLNKKAVEKINKLIKQYRASKK
jgi:TRAP-type C4-dicarboxylate transport system substrate-binding protein